MKISKAKVDEQRWKVRQVLEKLKPSKLNFLREEKLAIKTLQSNMSIIILPADKDNTPVVMDKLKYSEIFASLVGDGSCSKEKSI